MGNRTLIPTAYSGTVALVWHGSIDAVDGITRDLMSISLKDEDGIFEVETVYLDPNQRINLASKVTRGTGLVVVDAAAVWALLWRTANPENDPLDKAAAALELRALLGLDPS